MQDGVNLFVSVPLTHPAGGWHELLWALVSHQHFSRLPRRFFAGSLRYLYATTPIFAFRCSVVWQIAHLAVVIFLLCRISVFIYLGFIFCFCLWEDTAYEDSLDFPERLMQNGCSSSAWQMEIRNSKNTSRDVE